jgi:GTPase Era involved in 16S rRNA processing
MNKKFIPIIGTISAGKSTFLKAFLGVSMLQTGASTTTKFVCLIKHSNKNCFYHVIPKKENGIQFIKDGEETTDEEEIKKRIEKINENLFQKSNSKNDIFYVLETPINNINNAPLLESCYFMDIPGLNENKTNYIEDIFSLITINDILFEIMIFDSTCIGSDNILDIFKELEKKNCLKKEDNLYVLNKIDQTTKGGEGEIIDAFKNYFYKEFEDDKITDTSKIKINFTKNNFVPMNSLLYEAETKIYDDFYSMLLFELFTYLEYNSQEISNFYEFIQKRIESLVKHNEIDIESIEKKSKKIKDNDKEMQIIINSIEKIKKIIPMINKDSKFQLGIKIEKKETKNELKNLFIIHNLKKYNFVHSEFYIELQNIISKISLNENDLSSPPSIFSTVKNELIDIKPKVIKKNNYNPFLIIDELDKFINETFKLIDPTNELPEFKNSLNTLRENLLGRKIRISFIGNISVGKSTVLNCIIGDKILPTKDTECTYRGVIIRNKNIDHYELYRTKLVSKGSGLNQYYYFEDDNNYYCNKIKDIKSYLKNKNSDKIIKDQDAYIVIYGRLKIFDYIDIDQSLINKIEFVDLPGLDRKNNTFNNNKYYEKILKFSNVCVYINEPKSINDKNSVNNMMEQYLTDKKKVFVSLRPKFIKTCIFLINKSDTIIEEIDRDKTVNNLIKNFPPEENVTKDNINISFFSGQSFIEYLEAYNKYVYMIDKHTLYILNYLYREFYSNIFYLRTFTSYITSKIADQLEDKFFLNFEEEIEVPNDFSNKIKNALNILSRENYMVISNKDENKIIQALYNIYYQLKTKDFKDTIYSHSFFNCIKDVIMVSDSLQNENLKNAINQFFSYADELFNKEIKKEDENQIKENKERCDFIKNILIPKTNELFIDKEKKIRNIIDLGKYKCLDVFNDELKYIEDRLKATNNDVENAAKLLEEKIQKIINDINEEQDKEVKSLLNEIEKLLKDNINQYYEQKDLTQSKINTNKGITIKMVISLFTSAVSGLAVRGGLVLFGQTVIAGAAAGATAAGATFSTAVAGALLGPAGIAIGFGVGVAISLGTFLVHWFSKTKRYKNGIEDSKQNLLKKLEEFQDSFSSDFTVFRESIINELNVKVEILRKEITSIDKKKWDELRSNYLKQKDIIKQKIESNISD